jgi:hypothetical protein
MKDPFKLKPIKEIEIKPVKLIKGIVGVALGLAILSPVLNLFKSK